MTRNYSPKVLDKIGKAELRMSRTLQLRMICTMDVSEYTGRISGKYAKNLLD